MTSVIHNVVQRGISSFFLKVLPDFWNGNRKTSVYFEVKSPVDIDCGQNYNGTWSSNLWLSFLINENILGKCFRSSSSYGDPRI